MNTKIFVNLPVKDLDKSIEFFTKTGFGFNQRFTDKTASCMIVSDNIFVMLLTEEKFRTFTPKGICEAGKCTEVIVCLSLDSREKVDEIVRKAVSAGATTYSSPQDQGFMYGHAFQDLDGHIWEFIHMAPDEEVE
jgi:hypothetical protein